MFVVAIKYISCDAMETERFFLPQVKYFAYYARWKRKDFSYPKLNISPIMQEWDLQSITDISERIVIIDVIL